MSAPQFTHGPNGSRIGDLPERLFAHSLTELVGDDEEQEPSAFFYEVQDAAHLLAEIRNAGGGNGHLNAAPALYDALEAMVAAELSGSGANMAKARHKACAALAKARGESQ